MATDTKATDTKATDSAPKAKRNRKPSAFAPKVRVNIMLHNDVTDVTATGIGEALTAAFGEAYSVRVAQRTRARKAGAKEPSGIVNASFYIAPQGFTYAASAERGVRLDAETANLLREAGAKLGVDVSNPNDLIALAKALASNVLSK